MSFASSDLCGTLLTQKDCRRVSRTVRFSKSIEKKAAEDESRAGEEKRERNGPDNIYFGPTEAKIRLGCHDN